MKQNLGNEMQTETIRALRKELPMELISKIYQRVIFKPNDKEELQAAVNEWCDDKKSAIKKYGDIKYWNTSKITDMSRLFSQELKFNEDTLIF